MSIRSLVQLQRKPFTGTIIFLAGVVILAALLGSIAAVIPDYIASIVIGVPALILAFLPQTRFWALLMIFAIAPFMPFVKAFTGVRYGPLILDAGLFLVLAGEITDQVIDRDRRQISRLEVGLLAFMLLGLVQVFNPLGPSLTAALEGYRILIWQAVGYFLGRRLIKEKEQVKFLVFTLLIVSALVALYGIKQFFLPSVFDYRIIYSTSGDPITYTSLGQRRAFSTMSSPAHLSYFMVSVLLLIASVMKTIRHKTWLLSLILIAGLALLLTIVRTGWMGLFFGLGMLGLMKAVEDKRITQLARQILPAICVLVLVASVLSSYIPEFAITRRLYSLTRIAEDNNLRIRTDSWTETIIPAILRNPLGYGIGSDGVSDEALFYSHNGFFYILIETGAPGLVLILSVLIIALGQAALKHFRLKDPFLISISRWTITFWCVLMFMSSVGALLEVYPIILYAWFFLGVVSILPDLEKPRQDELISESPGGLSQ